MQEKKKVSRYISLVTRKKPCRYNNNNEEYWHLPAKTENHHNQTKEQGSSMASFWGNFTVVQMVTESKGCQHSAELAEQKIDLRCKAKAKLTAKIYNNSKRRSLAVYFLPDQQTNPRVLLGMRTP